MVNEEKHKKRVLIVGNWNWDIYEEALARGFLNAGWDVVAFRTTHFLPLGRLFIQLRRFRLRQLCLKMNNALLSVIEQNGPELIFFIRCDEVLSETIANVRSKSPNSILISFHNDNPYVGLLRRITMRHFLRCLALIDLTLVYRPSDTQEAKKYGSKKVKVLPPSIIRDLHLPTPGIEKNDVIFIGHYENDGREQIINYLNSFGIKIRIYGTGWEGVQRRNAWLANQDIRRVWGQEYAALLSNAKIALVFLSQRNRDVYTRRCFEIPACGSLMMAPRTKEMEGFFENEKEAIYWDSLNDLKDKVQYYLNNDLAREKIAHAGRDRLLKDGHDEYARARQVIKWYEQIMKDKERNI